MNDLCLSGLLLLTIVVMILLAARGLIGSLLMFCVHIFSIWFVTIILLCALDLNIMDRDVTHIRLITRIGSILMVSVPILSARFLTKTVLYDRDLAAVSVTSWLRIWPCWDETFPIVGLMF